MSGVLKVSNLLRHAADPFELFAAHGINVWRQNDVRAYMRRQVDEYPGNWAWRIQRRLPPVQLLRDIIWGVMLLCTVAFATGGAAWLVMDSVPDVLQSAMWTAGAVAVFVTLCLIADEHIIVQGVKWEVEGVTRETPLPAFARGAMHKARQLFPIHGFLIARLYEVQTRTIVDPVLYVVVPHPHGKGRTLNIAIAVWDEHENEVLPPS